jgi:hypothetical protein
MKRSCYLVIIVLFLLAACGAQPGPTPTLEQPEASQPSPTTEQSTKTPPPTDTPQPTPLPPTDTPAPTELPPTEVPPTEIPRPPTEVPTAAEAPAVAEFSGLPLPTEQGKLFSASGACTVCHTDMVDKAGNDVSVDTFWRGSMMANAARDPYWLASVQAEALTHPEYQAVIEGKCAQCHMPMAHYTVAAAAGQGSVLGDGFTNPEHALHTLAIDGISCTLCHQIRDDNFGQADSHSGSFAIDTALPAGEREAFGPHPVAPDQGKIMQGTSGFVPVESLHVEQAELCATCHTLYTPYVDAAGEIAGVFPEQMAYFEWLASSFGGAVSCQFCHMPKAQGEATLSITGSPPREPIHRHTFVGGNAYMLEILRTFGEEMAVTASSAQIQDKQGEVIEQLQMRTATIDLEEVTVDGSTLTASVAIDSSVGHKFPTGFPARRAWIRLTVQDAAGEVLFESGAANPDGSIVGNDNDADPAAYEPHHLAIDSPEQVQIYEAIMGDTEGAVTTTLLKGAGYLKDNRLPPQGFDKNAVKADIAVHGAALEDRDFGSGSDQVQYVVALDDAEGPFTVTTQLLYQSIGFRWADNMHQFDAPEPARFLDYYEQVPNQPVVIAAATVEAGQ